MDDPKVAVGTASLAAFIVYHKFEPKHPFIHALLLLAPPFILASRLQSHLSPTWTTALTYGPVYWALILTFVVGYRVSPIHPLSKYPGPLVCRISKLWMAYITARGDAHEAVRLLHAQYGDTVRVGPNELSFCRSDAVQPILAMKELQKGPYYDTRQQDEGTALDGLRDFSVHAARKKPWAQAMSSTALKGYDMVLVSQIHHLIDCLDKRASAGDTINISDWMSFFGFDFMGRLVFGTDFGMMKSGSDVNGMWHLMEAGTSAAGIISHIPWTFPVLQLIPGAGKEFHELQAMGQTCAKQRIKNGSQTKDIFFYLMNEGDPHAQVNAKITEVDGMMAIIAGSDTSATALSHVWYFLLRYPQCFTRLRKEIDEAFPHGEDPIDFSRQADMPYLNACINEALRLYPPVLSGLQRRVELGSGGKIVSRHFVPEGTQVSVHAYSLQRDPRYFSPIPEVFWPDRWIKQDQYTLPTGAHIAADRVTTDRSCFLPFSTGPQSCAGKNLAMLEMRAVVCALAQRFEVEVAKGFSLHSWEENIRDIYITLRGPLLVNMVTRVQ